MKPPSACLPPTGAACPSLTAVASAPASASSRSRSDHVAEAEPGEELNSSPDPATLPLTPAFPRCPGETPRAYGAFQAFFQLGQARSLQGVAAQLGERYATVKAWASRYRWSQRLQSYYSGLLEQQAAAETAARCQQAVDWVRRNAEYREQEWAAAQKLLLAAQCFLENFGEREVEKMTLAQVSRALAISSRMARQALSGTGGPEAPAEVPLQLELVAALSRAYAQSPPADAHAERSSLPSPSPSAAIPLPDSTPAG